MTLGRCAGIHILPLVLAVACNRVSQAGPTPHPGRIPGQYAPGIVATGLPGHPTLTRGDTLGCERSERFDTPRGPRWLWLRVVVMRSRVGTDSTYAETMISSDSAGNVPAAADTVAVRLDGGTTYLLPRASGVATPGKPQTVQAPHRATGQTSGPSMGPIAVDGCGV